LRRRVTKSTPSPIRSAAQSSIITARKCPGTIVVDSDNHYLYFVQDGGKAIRYGVTVGEEALSFSGIAKVGNMAEWPKWTPTAEIHKRIEGLPASVPAASTTRSAPRALFLQGNRDTLFRIHGTNQPRIYRRLDLLGLHSA